MPDIRRILSPVDFSPASDRALGYAVGLAEKLGAVVDAVHAYQIPVYAFPDGAVMATPEFITKLTGDLQTELDDLIRRHSGSGVSITGHLVQGHPHEEVNRMATDLKVDMIVMGTHGRTGLSRFLLGSVAERVVRTSTLPVLTVQQPDESKK